MVTKLEQDMAEAVCLCLPMIAESLASIAKCLETQWACNASPKDSRDYSGMGPGG